MISKAARLAGESLWLICISFFLLTSFLVYKHVAFKKSVYQSAREELVQLTSEAAKEIDKILMETMESAAALAEGLSSGKISRENMHEHLKEMLLENPNFYGGTITFRPYGYDSRRKLYSAYYSKSGNSDTLEYVQLDELYDYTKSDYDWYVEPMLKGNRWGEPYWDEAGKTYMTTFSALFYAENSEGDEKIPKGLVTIDISMSRMRNIIESLDIGPSGFGALTTREGNYLYHPNYNYVLEHKNLIDIAGEKNDDDRLMLAKKAALRESGVIDHVSTTTGQLSWLIFEPVPLSGWSLQNTFIRDDVQVDVDALRKQVIWIILSAIAFLSSLAAVILKVQPGNPLKAWALSLFVSLLFVIGIAAIWKLALTYNALDNGSGKKITHKSALGTIVKKYDKLMEKKKLSPPTYIPTGIFIDAIKPGSANDVTVTGRIWQKYPASFPGHMVKKYHIGRAKNIKITKTDIHKVGDEEIVHSQFQADLRTQLDYSRYPLEVEHIGIQILPWETDQNLFLVPDLDAYKLLAASLLPGLDKEVFIPGWELTDTFFMLKKTPVNTNFGIKQNFDQDDFPALYYEIGMKRVFVDAFISNLTPLIVVTIILFSVTLLPGSIDISRVLSICVSVFFVVVFSHLAIRKNISIGEIFYLEYFFFVIYGIILLAPMNAFRVALNIESRFFEYENGLLYKVAYWPSILGVFFGITTWKFY
ncbi:MAG: hypothetical protein OEV42_02580 [Deltaproteobacteria bacterium]|nr:hypothetical protein [Deltaproteobacteria bacterium]